MTIGERIKQRRLDLELSVDDLADRLGKSRATIYRYENGDIKNMPTTILEPLAEALFTTPAYLMGWTDDPDDWERTANDAGIAPPNDFDGDPEDWYRMKMAQDEDHWKEEQEKPYYINDETREIAQVVFENPELRTLFHVARDIPPERLKAHIEFMKSLKAQEKGDTDEEC